MTENWRSAVGFEGLYEVSDQGRVRSITRVETFLCRGKTMRRRRAGKLLRQQQRNGYLAVPLSLEGNESFVSVHRLVLEAFVGPCPAGMETRHLDGNKERNALTNLAWGTKSENIVDQIRHGTHSKARVVACPRGHELVNFNLDPDMTRKGRRSCWACKIADGRARGAERSGRRFDRGQAADQFFVRLSLGWRPNTHAERTHCPRRHRLAEPNLEPGQLRLGKRSCWACSRARDDQRTAVRRGEAFDFQESADRRYAQIAACPLDRRRR